MSEVKKYLIQKTPCGTIMKAHAMGDWVQLSDYDDAMTREAALREELTLIKSEDLKYRSLLEQEGELRKLKQRLTDAEKRAAVMEKALTRIAREHDCGCWPCTGSCVSQTALEITVEAMRDIASDALKPEVEREVP